MLGLVATINLHQSMTTF